MRAVVPALRRRLATGAREHLRPAQPDLARDLLDGGVVGGDVAGHEPLVAVGGGQQVADAEVTGADPLLPRHPRRRDERVRAGQQDDLAHRDRGVVAGRGQRDRPAPAAVPALPGGEVVGEGAIVLGDGLQVLADGVGRGLLTDVGGCLLARRRTGPAPPRPRAGRAGRGSVRCSPLGLCHPLPHDLRACTGRGARAGGGGLRRRSARPAASRPAGPRTAAAGGARRAAARHDGVHPGPRVRPERRAVRGHRPRRAGPSCASWTPPPATCSAPSRCPASCSARASRWSTTASGSSPGATASRSSGTARASGCCVRCRWRARAGACAATAAGSCAATAPTGCASTTP